MGGNALRQAIERWFTAWGRLAYRRAWLVVASVLLATGGLATQLPSLALDTSTEGFLREDDPIRVDYEAFRHQFGRDDAVLIAIEGERVFDPDFLVRLRALHEEIEQRVPKLQEVTSLVNARETLGIGDELVVRELLEEWPQTPAELAAIEARAMANPLYLDQLISGDGKVTTIVIETDAYSSKNDAVDAARALEFGATDASGTPPPFITGEENSEIVNALSEIVERHRAPGFRIHVAGMPLMVDHLARALQHDMQRFTGLSILVIATFLFALFRRVAAVVLPLVVVILSLVSTLALMGLAGIPISLPTQILPSFLLAVGVGDSVHVLTIFYQRLRAGESREDAIARALGHSGLAIMMTSLTTAAGLASFLSADLAPIADFGVIGPIGVLLALLFTILLLPALIALFPMRAAPAADGSRRQRRPGGAGRPGRLLLPARRWRSRCSGQASRRSPCSEPFRCAFRTIPSAGSPSRIPSGSPMSSSTTVSRGRPSWRSWSTRASRTACTIPICCSASTICVASRSASRRATSSWARPSRPRTC